MQNTDLKTIAEIVDAKYRFFIPSNQRGYRWRKQQVEDLLNDIFDFLKSRPTDEQFYCLQPLIVKEQDGKLIVVDGQQRLTTAFIILSYLYSRADFAEYPKDIFSIEYETRPGSEVFLKNLFSTNAGKVDGVVQNNIDYKFIKEAADIIKAWFVNITDRSKGGNIANPVKMFEVLFQKVKFIWYEIKNDDPHDVFARINAGKIPLTDAELIKAVLLNQKNFSNDAELNYRDKIAAEWDDIEKYFGSDDFWYFISERKEPSTRIDLLFDFYITVNQKAQAKSVDYEYRLFNQFLDAMQEMTAKKDGVFKAVNALWEDVVEEFERLRQWYDDSIMYHKIGYIIAIGKKASDVAELLKGKKKSESQKIIDAEINKSLNLSQSRLGELDYDKSSDKKLIKNALLLFNVETIVSSKADIRFSFNKYKNDMWDIEHVHAREDNMPEAESGRRKWLETLKNPELLSRIFSDKDKIKPSELQSVTDEKGRESLSKDKDAFERIYKYCIDKSGDESDDTNGIGNLTLLDAETNRSYQNAIFPIKREEIIKRDKDGVFIPICTKNVFLKYYSTDVSNMLRWTSKDRVDYAAEIERVLHKYLTEAKK